MLRLWNWPALKNITGVARMNIDHCARLVFPVQKGRMNHIRVALCLGTSVIYTMPMIKVGIAMITADMRRRSKARCSCACRSFARSSSVRLCETLTSKGGDFAEAIAEMMWRRVNERGEGLYVMRIIGLGSLYDLRGSSIMILSPKDCRIVRIFSGQ